jgi:hypothetical protein
MRIIEHLSNKRILIREPEEEMIAKIRHHSMLSKEYVASTETV